MALFSETQDNVSGCALDNTIYQESLVLFLVSHKLVVILFPSSIVEKQLSSIFFLNYVFKSIKQHSYTSFSSSECYIA